MIVAIFFIFTSLVRLGVVITRGLRVENGKREVGREWGVWN